MCLPCSASVSPSVTSFIRSSPGRDALPGVLVSGILQARPGFAQKASMRIRHPLALTLLLAACAPPEAEIPMSRAARDAPPPRLGETARLRRRPRPGAARRRPARRRRRRPRRPRRGAARPRRRPLRSGRRPRHPLPPRCRLRGRRLTAAPGTISRRLALRHHRKPCPTPRHPGAARGGVRGTHMNSIIYLVGLVVIVLAVLSLVGMA